MRGHDADGDEAERDADEAADDAERERLDQELHQHVAAARADRHAAGRSRASARSPRPA